MTGLEPGSAFPNTITVLRAFIENQEQQLRDTGSRSPIFDGVKRELGTLSRMVEAGKGDFGAVAHEGAYDIMHPRRSNVKVEPEIEFDEEPTSISLGEHRTIMDDPVLCECGYYKEPGKRCSNCRRTHP